MVTNPCQPNDRTPVTPGRLYALLSAAFRQARTESCGMCKMPMPFMVAEPGGAQANWRMGPSIYSCGDCGPLIEAIVERFTADYDLRDATAAIPPGRAGSSPSSPGSYFYRGP